MPRLIPPLSAEERMALIAAARALKTSNDGKPAAFGHRGRQPWKVDCVGTLVLAFRDIGYDLSDRRAYGRDPAADGLGVVARDHFGPPIPKAQMAVGDIVTMKWHQMPAHVALVTDHPGGGLAVLHCYAMSKQVIEHILGAPWTHRIHEVFRP